MKEGWYLKPVPASKERGTSNSDKKEYDDEIDDIVEVQVSKGSYSYIAPDGTVIKIK